MRCGFPGLALKVQEVLKRDPLGGHLFVFRGRRGDLIKVIWHDGDGACLFTKRLEKGVSSGPRQPTALCRSRRRNSAIFFLESTGGTRARHLAPKRGRVSSADLAAAGEAW